VNKMAENTKIPAIRFAGFTEAWEQRKLGEVVGIYDGVHQTPKYQDNGIMFLSVENIATLQSSKYISEDDFKRDYKVYPQENDILMTRIGDVGTTNVIADKGLKAYYVSLALLKYKSTNPYFLSNAIQSDYVKKGLANRTLKTAIPMKINKEEIGKVDVMLPISVKEQSKIGEYFRNLDHLITLHQRKYEKLTNVKKSMLEKMFPKNGSNVPEIRFKGFTEAWEQCKLSDLVDVIDGDRGKNYPIESDFDISGHTLFLNASNVTTDGFAFDNNQFISEEKSNSMGNGKLNEDDIIITSRGSLGHIAWYNAYIQCIVPYARINSGMLILRKKKSVSTSYLNQFLKSEKGQNQISFMSFGSAQPQLTKKGVEGLLVNYPGSLNEQDKLGEYFANLDYLITLHQRKLEKLKNIKKSMLEKMFI